MKIFYEYKENNRRYFRRYYKADNFDEMNCYRTIMDLKTKATKLEVKKNQKNP